MALQPRERSDLRGLIALVAFLGVLVVIGTGFVIGIVIHRIYGKAPGAAPGPVPGVTAALPVAASRLAQGERVGGIAGAGGEVAIWVTGPAGDRVLLLDPATGKLRVAVSAPP